MKPLIEIRTLILKPGTRREMEDAYYGSDDWRKGPREAMLALIESYVDAVFELD